MSNATDRAAIVDALKTVAELEVSATKPTTATAMAAWPVWSFSSPVGWCLDRSEWFVFVIAPNGDADTTVEIADEIATDVVAALTPIAKVTRWEPWQIPIEPGQQTTPVVRFTLEI